MSIERTPRVAFDLDVLPVRRARKLLARTLQRHLARTFESVRSVSHWWQPSLLLSAAALVVAAVYFFSRRSLLHFTVNGEAFFVRIGRYKYGERNGRREWFIAIDPAKLASRRRFPKSEERKYARDLMLISDEIHALLANMPSVTGLRWYFKGWNVKKPGALTPAELPWHIDVPELRGAEQSRQAW